MIASLIICGLFYKIDCYANQIQMLSNEISETHSYYEGRIENLKNYYEKELTNYNYEKDKEVYGEQFEDKVLSEIVGFDIQNIKEADKTNWYYYSKLTDEQKEVYEEVMFNVIKQQSYTFTVPGFTKDDIWNFIKYIQFDHERIFWIDWNAPESMKYNVNTEEFIFKGQAYENLSNIDDIYNAWIEIQEYKENVLKDTENLEPRKKEMQIYNYIATHTRYNLEAPMAQSLYSAVKGETVCTGYTKMFKYLCNESGINCINIYGKCKDNNENHLWNIVNIDEQTYMVDCVKALVEGTGGEIYISYNGFNASLEYMDKYYIVNDYFKVQ